jgi:hypothetical protein
MKKIRRAARDGRRALHTARAVAQATRKGATLAQAASHVAAKRTALGLAAMANPASANQAELSRIVPEKLSAFGGSAIAAMRCSGELAAQASRFASSEIASATIAAADLTRCRTPAAAIGVQSQFVTGWFFRALSHSIAVNALVMRSYRDVMTPVHQVVIRNSRRLA